MRTGANVNSAYSMPGTVLCALHAGIIALSQQLYDTLIPILEVWN